MNKIIIDENYIKSLPLTTNRIEVAWNENVFFSKYAIVSYYSTSAEHKNLAYEQLSDSPCLSVAGIKAIWGNQKYSAVKFFILTHKGNARDILNSLQSFKDIVARIDYLEPYSNELKNRIVASLAINSLGKKKTSNMMYNDGSLLVCDNTNFGIQKRELVCLKVEVNKYMNLVANTQSFTHPLNDNELRKYKNCVFQKSKDFDGELWSGQAVKPITIKTVKDGEYDLNKLFILKKKSKKTKNNVPYWPYNPDKYTHGKLFVLFQVVESVNQDFDGILEINFTDYKVEHYDECKTEDGILKLMRDYLKGKTISFEDSFCTDLSNNLILQFKEEAQKIMQGTLKFPLKPTPEDIIVRLCEPKENKDTNTKYIKSTYRFTKNNNALQHITYYNNEKKDKIDKNRARRILIEFIVKDCLVKRAMPKDLAILMEGWEFLRYKINQGNVHGATLKITNNGNLHIEQYGLSQNSCGEDFESFVTEKLQYTDCSRINGAKDYMALKKDGNVYLIVDTEEIPILDAKEIDEGYDEVVNNGETIAMFRRKKNVHKYLRGYIGFHLWKSEGIDGKANDSFSYISGINKEKIKFINGNKMDKMPRARKIFILKTNNQALVDSHIKEICSMLKFGFGRWDELMTYPFPFKFLLEFLDNAAETAYSKHWEEISYYKDLF